MKCMMNLNQPHDVSLRIAKQGMLFLCRKEIRIVRWDEATEMGEKICLPNRNPL